MRAEQSRAERNGAEQSRAEQSRVEQGRAERSRAEQGKYSVIAESGPHQSNLLSRGVWKQLQPLSKQIASRGWVWGGIPIHVQNQ